MGLSCKPIKIYPPNLTFPELDVKLSNKQLYLSLCWENKYYHCSFSNNSVHLLKKGRRYQVEAINLMSSLKACHSVKGFSVPNQLKHFFERP